MPKNSLDLYNRKRDFSRTAEPKGAAKLPGRKADRRLRYVIQKHAASRLHFDFRLEYGGVLKSWAVPKGPCLDPAVKRLAVEVEDHPIEYGEFEGTIPRGEYGGGTVQLWDRGTWMPEDPAKVEKAFAKGHLAFELNGERLHGRWNLVRTSGRRYGGGGGGDEKGKAWLLIKGHDAYASEDDPDALAEIDQSIKTGRSMVEIATGKSAVWRSNRRKAEDPVARPARTKQPARRKASAMPGFVAPQLATLEDAAPGGTGWVHEIKLDGYRVQIHVAGGEAVAYTRKGLDWSDHFPEIVAAASGLPDCILDGEVVALSEGGQSDFSALQAALERNTTNRLVYFAFDLLYADGKDYRDETLETRKAALEELLGNSQSARIRYTEHLAGDGETIRQTACDMELEGIVSKKLDARYRSGRQLSWLKTKCRLRQEFVVGGYIRRAGGNPLTALVVGAYENGAFRYKGKVGTGYNAGSSAQLLGKLAKLHRKDSPFAKEGAQPEKPREIVWVKPQLVVEVEFASWTGSGVLRQASFKGLREDKPASEVQVEKAKSTKVAKAVKAAPASKPTVSNPDKLLWPDDGVTKQQLADYYAAFARLLLPHVAHRPISLIRAPDGIKGELFFQRHHSKGMPDGIKVAKVRAEKLPYVMIEDAEGLRGLAQFGVVEIHPWGAPTKNIEKPDQLIFDLDPDEGLAFPMIKRAALGMRAHLDNFGLHSFPKLTGGKGVHVVVPLVPHLKWDEAKAFTKEIAEAFERVDPANFTATMSKSKRKGRIFIDYLRNARTATAVSAWSPRARPGVPIAVPVTWEFFSGLKSLPVYSMIRPEEAARHFDAWKKFETSRVKLTRAMLKQAGI